ncbi:MAG: hypothetical protein ACTSR8_21535, partial [Promethearchaeota archaeon]
DFAEQLKEKSGIDEEKEELLGVDNIFKVVDLERELKIRDLKLEAKDQIIEEKDQIIEVNEKQLEEKDKIIEVNEKQLEAKEAELEEKDKIIEEERKLRLEREKDAFNYTLFSILRNINTVKKRVLL